MIYQNTVEVAPRPAGSKTRAQVIDINIEEVGGQDPALPNAIGHTKKTRVFTPPHTHTHLIHIFWLAYQ